MRTNPTGAAAPAPPLATLGDLRRAGYRARTVKQELRENALRRLADLTDAGQDGLDAFLPGIVGYGETVAPQVVQAILSEHDLLLLGLRGQAKTRILRALSGLLDEWIPVLARRHPGGHATGVELREDPLGPITSAGRALVAELGDTAPIEWVHRSERYSEKLATPDVTIADLIGEVDIVRHAEGRRLSDEATMHFGLIPRANRGLFAINELPDLAPRIQVGLFNVLEERDIQIRGYDVRLALDVGLCFSANPEDYTNRGRIVTPLKDRIGSVVRTHYPPGGATAMRITRENAFLDRRAGVGEARSAPAAAGDPPRVHSLEAAPASPAVEVPGVMHEIIEGMIERARKSPHVNQASGVSVRASIAALENAVSSAELRAVRAGEARSCVRPSDLGAVPAACRGKIELLIAEDAAGADGRSTEDKLIEALIGESVKGIVGRAVPLASVEQVAESFVGGMRLEVDDSTPAKAAIASFELVKGLLPAARQAAKALGLDARDEQQLACAGELVLELLYVNNRISKSAAGYAR